MAYNERLNLFSVWDTDYLFLILNVKFVWTVESPAYLNSGLSPGLDKKISL